MQDFAFAFQCFMLEFWDKEETGRWPSNPSHSPNVSDDPVVMKDLYEQFSKLEPNQEQNQWVGSSLDAMHGFAREAPAIRSVITRCSINIMPEAPKCTRGDTMLIPYLPSDLDFCSDLWIEHEMWQEAGA